MGRARDVQYIDPINTQQDVAVGIGLPFAGTNSVFNLNYTTEDQAMSNLINLVLTKKGERIMQPSFGWGGWSLLFEPNTNDFADELEISFKRDVTYWLPYITIKEVNFNTVEHTIMMSAKVSIEPSGANKTITFDLSSGGTTITED